VVDMGDDREVADMGEIGHGLWGQGAAGRRAENIGRKG
jgi:hypothetical protein